MVNELKRSFYQVINVDTVVFVIYFTTFLKQRFLLMEGK